MVKPGGDASAVHHALLKAYAIVHTAELPLTPADARRLYPDAYGADYVARQDAYLTSAPVQVLVLLAVPWAATRAKQVKARIRRHLGDTDMLRNHLHMPDNPGDALCDVCRLARSDILHDLYERYDRDSAAERLACYRTVLARR